jgi:hypothetical protein
MGHFAASKPPARAAQVLLRQHELDVVVKRVVDELALAGLVDDQRWGSLGYQARSF